MKKRINLALQGGGAHGAFTWGVLDRLLEQPDLEIAAISGTSAGAMNGAALKAGLVQGGAEGGRESLDALWTRIGTVGDMRLAEWMRPVLPFAAVMNSTWEAMFSTSPQGIAAQMFSPYDLGPAWCNPLDPVVAGFDFDAITSKTGPELFINATNVRTGKIGVFSGKKITPQALMASGCLPTMFKAVEAPDPNSGTPEFWWDGGYSGNPALYPLFEKRFPDDIVLVVINPIRREEVPHSPLEIQERLNEISFNAPLLRDLRAIAFVHRLISEGKIARTDKKDVALHVIADDPLMNRLSAGSKMLPTPRLLDELKTAGRQAADKFLKKDAKNIGKCSSVDPADLL